MQAAVNTLTGPADKLIDTSTFRMAKLMSNVSLFLGIASTAPLAFSLATSLDSWVRTFDGIQSEL